MGTYYNPRIVTDGLVLALDAGNAKSYPGSGTTWTDLSGRGNNGTLVNGPTYDSSNGGSIVLDGLNDFVSTPRIQGTGNSTSSVTWCVWTKPNDTDGNIMSMSSTDPQGGWNMPPIAAANSQFRGKIWSNSYLTSPTYTIGNWYYVCLIFNYNATTANAYQRLYVNGEQVAEQTNITYSSSGVDNYLFFGQANPGADNTGYYAGNINIAQVYSRALTAAEIKQNFNATRGRYGI